MPTHAVANLAKAEASKVAGSANTKDLDELKKALRDKCIQHYEDYKENNPGGKKHPGLSVYKSITDQVT